MGLGSTKPKTKNVATVSPEQQALIDQITQGVSGGLPDVLARIQEQLDPQQQAQFFQENIAAPQQEEFFKSIVPGIQQAGANLGAKGGSTIERQLAQAGSSLEKDLGRQAAQFQQQGSQQGIQNLLALLGPGLQSGFQPVVQQGQPGVFQQGAAGFASALPFILASQGLPSFKGFPGFGR